MPHIAEVVEQIVTLEREEAALAATLGKDGAHRAQADLAAFVVSEFQMLGPPLPAMPPAVVWDAGGGIGWSKSDVHRPVVSPSAVAIRPQRESV
jgi:hypothetical protein